MYTKLGGYPQYDASRQYNVGDKVAWGEYNYECVDARSQEFENISFVPSPPNVVFPTYDYDSELPLPARITTESGDIVLPTWVVIVGTGLWFLMLGVIINLGVNYV